VTYNTTDDVKPKILLIQTVSVSAREPYSTYAALPLQSKMFTRALPLRA